MKLIKINTDHYVIVDDSEIKEKSGDWFYSFETGKIYNTLIHYTAVSCKKITHSTKPIEYIKNGMTALSVEEVKELIGEVDVEKKAREEILYNDSKRDWWKQGYNQAIEDNKGKKYTEEDLWKAVNCAYVSGGGDDSYQECEQFIKEQILQPKTEWEVEIVDGKLKLVYTKH